MDSFYEKLQTHLFASREEIPKIFNANEQEMIIRYRATFTKWLEEPELRDSQIIAFLVNDFKVKKSQAYQDIALIKSLIGNVQNAGKEFQRHRATDMILQGYELAATAKTNTDIQRAMTYIKAAEAIIKVHKLDSNELEPIVWEDIIPLELEPSTDVSVIGRKPIENLDELKRKLRQKYGTTLN